MTAALVDAGTVLAQAGALAAVAYVVGRVVIAAFDSEVNRQRSRRADGLSDIEPRAYADAVRRIHGGTR